MIQVETTLAIADNSGAKSAVCIKVLGGSKKKYANIGDIIKVSVKTATPRGKIKKGEVHSALVVRTKRGVVRKDGTVVRFDDNSVILLSPKMEPVGSRIFGPVTRELKSANFIKVISLAQEVI